MDGYTADGQPSAHCEHTDCGNAEGPEIFLTLSKKQKSALNQMKTETIAA